MWKIKIDNRVLKDMKKLGHQPCQQILHYLDEIANLDDPRSRGEELQHQLTGLWRYRVGKYRIICEIQDSIMTVLVVKVGHRGEVYK